MTKKYWFIVLFTLFALTVLSCTSNLDNELPGVGLISDINNVEKISSIAEDSEDTYGWEHFQRDY